MKIFLYIYIYIYDDFSHRFQQFHKNNKVWKLETSQASIFQNSKIPILTYLKQIFRQIFIFISYFYYLKEEQDESVHADNAAMQWLTGSRAYHERIIYI